MPEHGSVLPRTRRGASSRPLAAAVSIALALLGTTVLALPASADDAPPAGDPIVAPAAETPAPTPSPEATEPAPSPTPSPSPTEFAPAPVGDPAPAFGALAAAAPLAAPAASAATITGPGAITGAFGESLSQPFTLGGTPRPTTATTTFSQPLPPGLTWRISTFGGTTRLWIEGTPTKTGTFATSVTVANADGSQTKDLTFTIYGIGVASSTTVTLARNVTMAPVTIPVDRYLNGASLTWTRTAGTLPTGISVTAVDGALRFTGRPTQAGDRNVTYEGVANVAGFGQVREQTVVRFRVGDAPTLLDLTPRTVRADQAMTPISINPTGATSLTTAEPLPAGLVLVKAGTSWRLSGTPSRTAMGEHTITLEATNDYGTATATLRLTVEATPAITVSDQTFTAGGDATHTVTATGWPLPQLSASGLPAGLTADGSTTGTLLITGSTMALGSSSVQVTATNGVGPAVQATYQLSIVATPVFAQDTRELTLRVGQAINPAIDFDASSYPPHTISVAPGSTLPAGLRISSNRLVGTPTDQAAGTHTVVIRATNSQGYDEQTLVITVLAAPAFGVTSGSSTFQLGQAGSYTFTTRGWELPTATAPGLPDGVTLEQVDATTWRIAGTVTDPDELGSRTVRIELANSSGTVGRTLTLRVEGFAWTGGPTDLVVEAGVPMQPFVVTSTAFPNSAFIVPTTPPSGMSCGYVTGSWSFPTPTDPGTDTWRCSGTLNAVGTFAVVYRSEAYPQAPVHTVTIRAVARPVIDAPATATVVADTDVSIPITVTGNPAPATVTESGLPDGLSIQPVAGGGWAIVGRVARSAVGGHDVTLSADNGLAATRSLALTVESLPLLPTGDLTLVVGTPHTGSVTADGSPAPTLQMTDGDLPDGLTWSATGPVATLEGTPTETGEFSYTVTATNVHGTTTQTYHVEVQEPAAFNESTVSVVLVEGVAASRQLPLAGFPYPAVTPTGSIPDGMTVEYTPGTAPVLTGTPTAGSAGTYTLVLTAANHTVLGDATDAVTIEVTVQAAATLAGTDPLEATVGTGVDHVFATTGSPAPQLTATGLPTGVTLVQDPGGLWHLAGTPAPGTGGRHQVTLTADNGVLAPATATMTLTVREPVARIVAPVVGLRVGTPAVVTVRADGGWPAPAALSVVGALPNGLRFVDQGNGTGQVLGTPAAGTAGSWQVTIIGDNGVGTARTTVTITVAAAATTEPVRAPAPAAVPADGDGAAPGAATDEGGTDPGTGSDDGDGGQDAGEGSDDAQAAPPVLDPEESITVEGNNRPWWWILGAVLVGAVLLGLRTLERKLRSI